MPLTNILLSLGAELPTKLSEQWTFVSSFLQDSRVASIAPSSARASYAVCQFINFCEAKVIVEFGGGTGSITRKLLQYMRKDARLFVFETNPQLAQALEERVQDPRLSILRRDALDIKHISRAMNIQPEVIVSGIPLSFMDDATMHLFMRSCLEVLSSSGTLVLYQAWIAPFVTASRCLKSLNAYFNKIKISYLWLNIPPLILIRCTPRVES